MMRFLLDTVFPGPASLLLAVVPGGNDSLASTGAATPAARPTDLCLLRHFVFASLFFAARAKR